MMRRATRLLVRLGPERLGPLLPLLRMVSRTVRRAECLAAGWGDRRYVQRTGDTMMPPASLRYRVHGAADIRGFLEGGRLTHERIIAALATLKRELDHFPRVLDWGCGCGRTLRWFAGTGAASSLHGTDIDAEAVAWARAHLPFATLRVNAPVPPLDYGNHCFDLVYAVSVLTHLDEDYQFRWLEELRRVTRPGALLLLSVHAKSSWVDLSKRQQDALRNAGFLYFKSESWKGIFPDWYQNAFHTRAYVEEVFARYFEVLSFLAEGMSPRQDLVVLRHRR